jgi:hypothetical protein
MDEKHDKILHLEAFTIPDGYHEKFLESFLKNGVG